MRRTRNELGEGGEARKRRRGYVVEHSARISNFILRNLLGLLLADKVEVAADTSRDEILKMEKGASERLEEEKRGRGRSSES